MGAVYHCCQLSGPSIEHDTDSGDHNDLPIKINHSALSNMEQSPS